MHHSWPLGLWLVLAGQLQTAPALGGLQLWHPPVGQLGGQAPGQGLVFLFATLITSGDAQQVSHTWK